MKVLHFYKAAYPDSFGGVEIVVHNLANGMSSKGHSINVLSTSDKQLKTQNISKDPLKQLDQLEKHGHSLLDFTENEEIKLEIKLSVDKLNQQFSNPEQIKLFSILPRDFSIDTGELTPTLKIRRKQINKNWSDIIESMYKD